MRLPELSRRRFVQVAGAATALQLPMCAADAPTAQAVVSRIQAALGGEWQTDGFDGFKAGDPSAKVTGIVTTAMATVDVLGKASDAGANLIISHEPTFFGRSDGPTPPPPPDSPRARFFRGLTEDDPVYLAKKAFIEERGLVVYRLHDNWLSRKKSEMTVGLAEALDWGDHAVAGDDALYKIPATTAEDAVAHIREKLNMRGGLRAVGDRKARVETVLLYPGFTGTAPMWQRYRDADLLITGEVREWENTFYAADIYTAGGKRGLITLGRSASEDPGMRRCADWIETVVDEVPATWIPAGDLYWRAV